jgi:integration host factor subunit alpha
MTPSCFIAVRDDRVVGFACHDATFRNFFGPTGVKLEVSLSEGQKVGLSRIESAKLVELVLNEITDCLECGKTVKLSSFGLFVVRKKGERMGRNPKTGEEAPISPRRAVVFKPSPILKQQMNAHPKWHQDPGE